VGRFISPLTERGRRRCWRRWFSFWKILIDWLDCWFWAGLDGLAFGDLTPEGLGVCYLTIEDKKKEKRGRRVAWGSRDRSSWIDFDGHVLIWEHQFWAQVWNLVSSRRFRTKWSVKIEFSTWEFDPGSERTLAAGLTHASRAPRKGSGRRVSNAWESTQPYGITHGNVC